MPCLRCLNVCALGDRGIADYDDSGYIVDIACPDCSKFDPQSSEQIFEKCDILSVLSGTLNKTNFTKAQQRSGLSYNAHGVLWDEELRQVAPPIEVAKVDPHHLVRWPGPERNNSALHLNDQRGGRPVGADS